MLGHYKIYFVDMFYIEGLRVICTSATRSKIKLSVKTNCCNKTAHTIRLSLHVQTFGSKISKTLLTDLEKIENK